MVLTFFLWTYYLFFKRSKTILFDRKLTNSIFLAIIGYLLVGKYDGNCQLLLLIKRTVSATFLLICFVSPKESTCETRKNVSDFTSKALFILGIIKCQFFRYSNVMTSWNAQAWNTKHILLNNLGSKHSLLTKFDQFM